MADEQPAQEATKAEEIPPPRGWRDLWQVPALTIGAMLLVAGLGATWATRPKPDVHSKLDRAAAMLEAEQYRDALTVINETVVPLTGEPYYTTSHEQRMRLIRGRAISLGQRKIGIDVASNHDSVVREYTLAERSGATLSPLDTELLIRSMLAVGDFDEAVARTEAIRDDESPRRIGLLRDMILRSLSGEEASAERARELLTTINEDPLLTTEDRVWVVVRQAEMQLESGFTSDAISRLLREMPRVADASDDQRASLFELLARAYMDDGSPQDAATQLSRAESLLDPMDPLMARVLLSQARIEEQFGQPPENLLDARAKLQRVIQRHSGSDSYLPALLALAEVEAGLDDLDESRRVYRRLVDELAVSENLSIDRDRVMTSLLNRVSERLEGGDAERAVRFAKLAEDLYRRATVPTEVLRKLADSARAWGDQVATEAMASVPSATDLSDVDPVLRNQAREQYVNAGMYFRRFADRVVLSNDSAHADGLWNAAQSFDKGGDLDAAILGYRQFAEGFPDHPNRSEAAFQLARALQARGDYTQAAAEYRTLIELSVDRERPNGAGPFAAMSYVPLAQCLLLDADTNNDEQADKLLTSVLDGVVGDATAQSFRDALVELGRLMYKRGEYPRAIERLTEVLGRYPEHPDASELRFQLADSYRLEAKALSESLDAAGTSANRKRWSDQRTEHLRTAIGLFSAVRDELESIDNRRRSPLQALYLRNAQFYLGDCAFDLGDYDTAIRHYTAARERYSEDASSLVALVQIFNAYVAMDDWARAETAGQRARRFHARLDPAAFDDPLMPMSRGEWERWLDAMYEMSTQAQVPTE